MSRIGNRPIGIEEGVAVEVTGNKVVASCNGKNSELQIPQNITVKKEGENLIVTRGNENKKTKSLHGLTARMLKNIITGVKNGFTSELQFSGTGYRVSVDGNQVILNMGYSHEIRMEIPEGITVEVKKNKISISGTEKQVVGQLAAKIRAVRPPEVYKGKGIKYKDELIKRKAGKKAAA
jgi:large subunit ribosomal protein L6